MLRQTAMHTKLKLFHLQKVLEILIAAAIGCAVFPLMAKPMKQPVAEPAILPQYLLVGQSLALKVQGRLLIENKQILEGIETGGSGMSLRGKSVGATVVHLGNQQYQLQVIRPSTQRVLECLTKATRSTVSLKAELVDGNSAVLGKLLRFSEWKKLKEECSSHGEWKASFTTPTDERLQLENELRRQIAKSGFPQFALRWDPEPIILLGAASKLTASAKKWLQSYGLDIETDDSVLEAPPQIRTQILIAEVKTSLSRKMGLRWPSSYNAQLIDDINPTNSNIFLTADFLESSGQGRLLARPELLSRSGSEAQFWAGGEIPITILGPRSRDVVWKKFGILLKVKATADTLGRMSIQISTEVSSLSGTKSFNGIPAISVNKLETHFDLSGSKTIALSGLLQNEDHSAGDGLPGLQSIPILGRLFGSQDFRESKTELVILVRPEVQGSHEKILSANTSIMGSTKADTNAF